MKYLLWLTGLIFAIATYAATTRTIEGDQIRSSDKIKLWSFPASGDTLTGNAATQTLTNKTISGASNTISNINLGSQVTGTLPITNGGTGQTSQTNAFDALSPLTTNGDILYHNGTDNVRLPAGSSGQFLRSNGAAAPSWNNVSVARTITARTNGTYNATTSDDFITVDTTAGSATINLPTAVGNTGKQFTIQKIANNTNLLTVDANASETIDGQLTVLMYSVGSSIDIVSNGTNWVGVKDVGASKSSFYSANNNEGNYKVEFASASAGGVVSGESSNWINGNCTASSPYTCTLNAVFSGVYYCFVTVQTSARPVAITAYSTASVVVHITDLVGTNTNAPFVLMCVGY